MAGLFVCYEPVNETQARITNTATVIEHETYADQLRALGQAFYFIPLDGHTGYFEIENGQVVAMNTREPFPRAFNKSTVALMEIATIPDVPPCAVRVSGPTIGTVVQHQGGDLNVQFALPGVYTIQFEAFPALPVELKLTVKSPLAS